MPGAMPFQGASALSLLVLLCLCEAGTANAAAGFYMYDAYSDKTCKGSATKRFVDDIYMARVMAAQAQNSKTLDKSINDGSCFKVVKQDKTEVYRSNSCDGANGWKICEGSACNGLTNCVYLVPGMSDCSTGFGGDYVTYVGCATSQSDAEKRGYIYSAALRGSTDWHLVLVLVISVLSFLSTRFS
eukprot:765850-Hanusia_phi.AAC.2